MTSATREEAQETGRRGSKGKPDPYEAAVVQYNDIFTQVNDAGSALFHERERSSDLIGHIEFLVNSIANTPKEFAAYFDEIEVLRGDFVEAEVFVEQELSDARRSAMTAGSGVAAGSAVAAMAPTAAMWVATTFGTASTGTAISTLSGAAATKAALAWLGGGALAAGGGGTAGGTALLALAGPIGWGVAGVSVLASVAMFTTKKWKLQKQKNEMLAAIKANTARMRDVSAELEDLLERTVELRRRLAGAYRGALPFFGADFASLAVDQQLQLGTLVNNTMACATLMSEKIELADDAPVDPEEESDGVDG